MSRIPSFPLRRDFLKYVGVASSLAVSGSLLEGQKRRRFPAAPAGVDASIAYEQPGDPQGTLRAQMKLNEKEFRESLAHLYDRVSELKQDVDAQHTADVFSLKVYKQTGEIEHLAKRLRTLARI